jgi:hypothetical protein
MGDDRGRLLRECWRSVNEPYRTPETARLAVRNSDAFLRERPTDGDAAAVRAAGLYRLGRYEDARAALSARPPGRFEYGGPWLGYSSLMRDAYTAMIMSRLGNDAEARHLFLRYAVESAAVFHADGSSDTELQALYQEALALIGPMDASGELPLDPFARRGR